VTLSVLHLYRLVPALGLLANFIRKPGLHCALGVEIDGSGQLKYGSNIRIGERTRIELAARSVLYIADNVSISRAVHFALQDGCRTRIGVGTTIQDGCRIFGDVVIGRNCILAPNVFVSSGTHVFDAVPELPIQIQDRAAPVASSQIRIFADSWFGINTVVTPGLTIGRGCVVGANSVLTSDLPPYSVAAGNPARIVRKRLEFAPKARIEANERDAPYFYDGFDLTLPRGQDDFAAESDFILALQHPNARAVRLCVSGLGGEITFGDQSRPIPPERSIVEFSIDHARTVLPFLPFHVSSICRIQWAELA